MTNGKDGNSTTRLTNEDLDQIAQSTILTHRIQNTHITDDDDADVERKEKIRFILISLVIIVVVVLSRTVFC